MDEYTINKQVEIESFISFFVADYPAPFYFPGEFHPFWELVYVLDGELKVSGDERVYKLKKGDIVFHKPMEFHRIWSSDGDIHALISAFRASGTQMRVLENKAFSLSEKAKKRFDDLISFADDAVKCGDGQFHRHFSGISKEKFQAFTNLFEIALLEAAGDTVGRSETYERGEDVYKTILTVLNESVYGKTTVKEIAEKCNFSVSQVKRIFAQNSDIGIHKYYLKLKTAEAIRLLGKGKAIGEISSMLRFSSQNYFSSVFRRETGLSPSEYRKKINDREIR